MRIKYSRVTVAPEIEPISSEEVKEHLKLDADVYTEEAATISIWIQAAREIVEERTGRSLITQTRVIKLDSFPCYDSIYLLYGPVQSVTSVKYYDENDELQTLSADSYWVDTDSDVARVVVKESWPQININRPNSVELTYVCGYGDEGADVPGGLRSAVLLYTAHLHKNREEGIERQNVSGILDTVPFGAEVLMRPFVVEQDVIQ